MNGTEFHSVKLGLDDAAWRKRMSRTAFMRESLTRNLAYFVDVESKVPDATEQKPMNLTSQSPAITMPCFAIRPDS